MEKKTGNFSFVFYVFLAIFISNANALASNTLPASIIILPENEKAILVEKETQMLYVYSGENGTLDLAFKAPCSTGEVFGPKKKAGDKKTPEGVYFLTDIYEDRYLTPIYGKRAFPSDYPNFMDLRQGKEGSAIWIHGTDKSLKPMDSNGCVAMENDHILSLSDHIHLNSTPLIIVEKILETDPDIQETRRNNIVKLLDDWTHSMETGTYHQYLSFYGHEYVPDISWWETWLKIRNNPIGNKGGVRLETANIGIYAQEDIVVALFDFILITDKEKTLIGKRKLFLQESGQVYKILGDVFQEKNRDFKTSPVPLIAAVQKQAEPPKPKEATTRETLEKWLKAWSSKDMNTYAGFYADDFYSDGMGKKAWVERKKQIAKKYKYITVTGKDFKIKEKNNQAEVHFFQHYESSGFSTKGTKQMKLVKKGGLWKISQENWKEN